MENQTFSRPERTLIGAIRWDAWYTHDGIDGSVVSAVEKTLSPSKFHERAPFFAEVTDDNKIIIPSFTQEIFDREMEYAIDIGIDYFAYVWYLDGMSAARKFHVASKYRGDVKFCACLDPNAIEVARDEISQIITEDFYVKVAGGRPLMYYFYSSGYHSKILADIEFYRNFTKSRSIPEPYVVIMNGSIDSVHEFGADAISKYGLYGTSTYKALTDANVAHWEHWRESRLDYIPMPTTGWAPEPRYVNPVSWVEAKKDSWAELPTPDELYEHVKFSLEYLKRPEVKPQTPLNTLIIYAWNEHDEGGWICPTLVCDEYGRQRFASDGNKLINEERAAAVKKAIAEARV